LQGRDLAVQSRIIWQALEQAAHGGGGVPSPEVFKKHVAVALQDTV